WAQATRLRPGRDAVYFAAQPWQPDTSHRAGWLAGVLDADGHCQFNRAAGAWVGFGQVPGPLLNLFLCEMLQRNFTIREFPRAHNRPTSFKSRQPFVDVRVLGGIWEQLRCLGTLRPFRLDLREAWDGATVGKVSSRAKVLAVERAGDQWFAG